MNFEHESTNFQWAVKKDGRKAFIICCTLYASGKQEWRLRGDHPFFSNFQDFVAWVVAEYIVSFCGYGHEDEMYWVNFWCNAEQPPFPLAIHVAHQVVTGGIGFVV